MKSDTYHHGNLKEELIENGLKYIDKYGTETFSMRKLADSIGVSPAAPYAHFKNREAFLVFKDSFGIRQKLCPIFS